MADQHNSGKGLVIGGIVLFIGYEAYKHIVKPGIVTPVKTAHYVQRMRIGKIYAVKLKNDTIEFKFPIENPNTTPMVIKAIVGEVFVTTKKGNIKLGSVNQFGTTTIKPVGSTDFDLILKVNLVNEFRLLADIFTHGAHGAKVTFKGTVTANDRPWPVNETILIK